MFKCCPEKTSRHKSETDWSIGVFVGIEPRSPEYLMITQHGLYKCRTVIIMPKDKAFSAESIEEAKHGIDTDVNKGAQTTLDVRQGELARDGVEGGRDFAPRYAPQASGFRDNGLHCRMQRMHVVARRHICQTRPYRGMQKEDGRGTSEGR